MKTRIAFFVIVGVLVGLFCMYFNQVGSTVLSTELAIAQVNGGTAEWQNLTLFEQNKNTIPIIVMLLWVALGIFLFRPKKIAGNLATACLLFALTLNTVGCRAYDTPEYKEIKPNETAFVIPLDIDNKGTGQAKFDSAAYLESKKVAQKRIQITHRWIKEGRLWFDGKYIPSSAIIVVDRQPITQEWVSKDSSTKGKDYAIWTESADSVGFSMGWTATAYIKEEDASTFLYFYPSAGLASVMASEIRGRIQKCAANFSAQYKLDVLRDKKNEMAKLVESDVIDFFSKRGITITMVGQFGGMTYENPKIQEAIDNTFVSQQEKVNAAAFLAAQEDKNRRINSEATALAEAARAKAKGEADGIEFINNALAKASNNPQLIELRRIEVEKAHIDKWKGEGDYYPNTVVGAGAQAWVGLSANNPVETIIKK
jgi:hypothetical protein